uniref:Uncharacterized protein n=1 Tax=Rhizophora mucronata TaxID=61149 RepID=A0A2P2NDP1_RHIMU
MSQRFTRTILKLLSEPCGCSTRNSNKETRNSNNKKQPR